MHYVAPLMFAKAYCEWIKKKYKEKYVWGAELAFTALSRKKGGADHVFPRCNVFCSQRARSEECVHPCDLSVRPRYCWGTAAIEITGIWRTGWWLHLHSPDLVLSQGGFFPLEWELANLQHFLSREIYIVFIAEATYALRSFSVHYMNLSHQTMFTCLGICLHLILKN